MFGEKLKELRKLHKQTQVSLARALGVSNGTVAMWETGKRQPDLKMLSRVAAHFGVSVDELLGNQTFSNIEFVRLLRLSQGSRSTEEYASALGISVSVLSSLQESKMRPSLQVLRAISSESECVSFNQLLSAAGYHEESSNVNGWVLENLQKIKKRTLPVFGEGAHGVPNMKTEEKEFYFEGSSEPIADFCVVAKDDSMIGAGIKSGDVVFAVAQDEVNNGEIAVVLIDDKAELKRYYCFPEKQRVVLNSENPAYPPLFFEENQKNSFQVIGKAVFIQKKL